MFDDDDFSDLVWSIPEGLGLVGSIFAVGVLVVAAYFLYENHQTCAERTCTDGSSAQLLEHDCKSLATAP